ncbi:hypothetical protein VX159_11535 [Dechloromonas sp. ZY10]|uniref:hypothetical protein n=1 Tax=Dechloromonas aquae TaxID=2664436 RepID=UPI0035289442
MNTPPEYHDPAGQAAAEILAWLSSTRPASAEPGELLRLLQLLDSAPLPSEPRQRFLDLIYSQALRLATNLTGSLGTQTLPLPRPLRQRTRQTASLLALLAETYARSPAFPATPAATRPHHLWQALQASLWQLRTDQQSAAPSEPGTWLRIHALYQRAHEQGIHQHPGPRHTASIEALYLQLVLAAIAQPTSFSPDEIGFIGEYLAQSLPLPELSQRPGQPPTTFWIDPNKDLPAQALVRRNPPPETAILYLDCQALAARIGEHCQRLQQGATSERLGLPPLPPGLPLPATLRRLQQLWGEPARRRFPRRRQSYRASLLSGLDTLNKFARDGSCAQPGSQWMVINESPDGYALMHLSGDSSNIRVGDVVAIQPQRDSTTDRANWQTSLIRWVVSENPEHLEIGLQVLAPQMQAAEIAGLAERIPALFLPEKPPLRPQAGLIVAAGSLPGQPERLLLLVEQGNLCVREVRPTRLEEQTASVEIFSVEPDHSQ